MTSVERENERLKDKVYDLTAEFKGLLSLKKENEALSKRNSELEVVLETIDLKHRKEMRREYRRNRGLQQRLNEATKKFFETALLVDSSE